MEATSKKSPEKKISVGNIQVAVWKNQAGDKSFYSVTCEKRYMKDNEWKSTNNFNKNDLPKVSLAIQEAYKYLTMEAPSSFVEEKEDYSDIKERQERHHRFVEEETI